MKQQEKAGSDNDLWGVKEESIRKEQSGDRENDGWGQSLRKRKQRQNKWWGQDDNKDRKMAVLFFLSVFSHFVICYHSLSSHHSHVSFSYLTITLIVRLDWRVSTTEAVFHLFLLFLLLRFVQNFFHQCVNLSAGQKDSGRTNYLPQAEWQHSFTRKNIIFMLKEIIVKFINFPLSAAEGGESESRKFSVTQGHQSLQAWVKVCHSF